MTERLCSFLTLPLHPAFLRVIKQEPECVTAEIYYPDRLFIDPPIWVTLVKHHRCRCSALLLQHRGGKKRADILADLSVRSCTYHIWALMPWKSVPAPTRICKPAHTHTLTHCSVTLTVNLRLSAVPSEGCLLGRLVNNQSYTCTLSGFMHMKHGREAGGGVLLHRSCYTKGRCISVTAR